MTDASIEAAELVRMLRGVHPDNQLAYDAADFIERLTAERAELIEALVDVLTVLGKDAQQESEERAVKVLERMGVKI